MASSKSKQRRPGAAQNQLRIIGGQWRGRKLEFEPSAGLRPTSDRIRETLFNWLAPEIAAARCADLFAGSGALGLEALSRGAAHCDFVDQSAGAARQISKHLRQLDALAHSSCQNCSASQYLNQTKTQLDLVFIDPPFGEGMVQPIAAQLSRSGLLAPAAFIYIETPAREAPAVLPEDWRVHRQKSSGGVSYCLYTTASP
jgi:16S rRNA (guanine966-N2)-methyltransferase